MAVTRASWLGGAKVFTSAVSFTPVIRGFSVIGINLTTTLKQVRLPNNPTEGTSYPLTDGRVIYVYSVGVNNFSLIGISSHTIRPTDVAKCVYSSADEEWHIEVRDRSTIASLSPPERALFALGATALNKYDPTVPGWVAGTVCPRDHSFGAAAKVNNRGYFVGYYPLTSSQSEKNDELNDLGGGTFGVWTVRADCPIRMGENVAADCEERGYFFEGNGGVRAYKWSAHPLAWAAVSSTPIKKARGSAAGLGPKIVLVSGDPVPAPNLSFWASADSYWTIGNMVAAFRYLHSSFKYKGKAIVVGGKSDSPTTHYASVESYNPVTEAFTALTALGASVYGGKAFSADRKGYYCGGRNSAGTALSSASSYNDGTWISIGPMVSAAADGASQGLAI